MIQSGKTVCPKCGGPLKYYGCVKRTILTKRRASKHIYLRRLRCEQCKALHREIPDDVLPFKQYEAEVIRGVIEGLITSDTLGFENYPCEMTMKRWISRKNHLVQ